jgi:hypothetical protein
VVCFRLLSHPPEYFLGESVQDLLRCRVGFAYFRFRVASPIVLTAFVSKVMVLAPFPLTSVATTISATKNFFVLFLVSQRMLYYISENHAEIGQKQKLFPTNLGKNQNNLARPCLIQQNQHN